MNRSRQLIVNKHAANDGFSTIEAEARFIEVSAADTCYASLVEEHIIYYM